MLIGLGTESGVVKTAHGLSGEQRGPSCKPAVGQELASGQKQGIKSHFSRSPLPETAESVVYPHQLFSDSLCSSMLHVTTFPFKKVHTRL